MPVVPSQLLYQSGGNEVAIAASRREVVVIPENGPGPYYPSSNRVIRISLSPSLGYLDTHESFLSFRVRPHDNSIDLTKECRMDKSSLSWVRKFTIYSSTGSRLEEIEHYNLLSCLMHEATGGKEYTETIGTVLDNHGTKAERNACMTHPKGSMFNSGFDCSGVLGGDIKVIPLPFCQGPMVIELELEEFSKCFIGEGKGGKTPEYEIANVQYHASVLSMAEEYSARMSEQVRTSGVDLAFVTTRTHNQVIKNNQEDLPISQNASSVRGTYHVLRDSTSVTDTKKDSLSTYKSGNIRSIQWDMGGHLTPQLAIRTEDDGTTSLYSHMLQSWNMFRNHSFGSKIDGKNYDTTETKESPLGLLPNVGYRSRPIQRVYGTWVANAAQCGGLSSKHIVAVTHHLYGSTATVAGQVDVKGVKTLSFVPNDPTQIALISVGQRCKMGVSEAIDGEQTSAGTRILQRKDDGSVVVAVNGDADELPNPLVGLSLANVATTGAGLDRFYKAELSGPPGYEHDNVGSRDNCLFAGASYPCTWSVDTTQATSGTTQTQVASSDGDFPHKFVGGLAIPFTDGSNLPIFSRQIAVSAAGWVDVMPDDDKFFLGNTFETFGSAAPQLVSGSDLTQATPLLLKLDYQEPSASDMYAPRKDTDNFTSFVQIDSVLRLQPDGLLISSV